MRTLQDQMLPVAEKLFLFSCRTAPEQENERCILFVQLSDDVIGQRFPTVFGVGKSLSFPDGQDRIQKQYTLVSPIGKVPMIRDPAAAVGSKFFIDVDQRGRCRYAFGNGEGETHRLPFFMIGILAKDHDLGRGIGSAAQRIIKISCRREDRSGAVFLIEKGSELLIIRGVEF